MILRHPLVRFVNEGQVELGLGVTLLRRPPEPDGRFGRIRPDAHLFCFAACRAAIV
jgi:hypothetical protein